MSEYGAKVITFIVTPIVAGIASWLVPWAAEHLPGAPSFDKDQLTALAVAGVAAVGAAAYKYIDNRGKHERAALFGSDAV